MQSVFFINEFNLGQHFTSFADAAKFALANIDLEKRIYIYESYDDEGEGAIRIVYKGDVKDLPPTDIEQYIMDIATANLGDRRNG